MTEHDIIIDESGDVHFVYADDLAGLLQADGEVRVTRASHVEPAAGGGWYADMRPVGGPVLYANGQADYVTDTPGFLHGFASRAEALDAEREWLRKERGL